MHHQRIPLFPYYCTAHFYASWYFYPSLRNPGCWSQMMAGEGRRSPWSLELETTSFGNWARQPGLTEKNITISKDAQSERYWGAEMSWGIVNPCNTMFCSVLYLGLGWHVEACPWQGEGVQLEKELKSESHEDCQSTGLGQLPQALWWTAHCNYSCLIKSKPGVSTVIWDGWAGQRNLTRICLRESWQVTMGSTVSYCNWQWDPC